MLFYIKDMGGCYSNPCFNGATCSSSPSLGYICTCACMFFIVKY